MKILNDVTELVGKTPLVKINSISKETGANVYGKLEYFNPLSSVKDRIAVAMIDAAEKDGFLKKDGLIIEPTSGNTGIGLAFVAAARGYKIILAMPDTMSKERHKLLKILGAELVLTPGDKGMSGAVAKAEELVNKYPGSFMPQQFNNPVNPLIHKKTTAPEIWESTDGKIDYFISGVGTGGTITGCGEFLKEKNSNIQVIAVEPVESSVLSGDKPGPHRIQGIGAGFIPDILNTEIYDDIVRVHSDEAGVMARNIAKEDGLLIGISSGAALIAAYQIALKNTDKNIIAILPSCGERYLSTWVYENYEN